jgi:hypothetical protein
MKVTRSTLMNAFAQMLGDRIDTQLPMAQADLLDEWAQVGLRSDDMHRLLENLYADELVDRCEIDGEPWYQLTARGCIELRVRRETFWVRLRDRLLLTRLRTRRNARVPAGTRAGRRRTDFPQFRSS